jgi:hypothetical protein
VAFFANRVAFLSTSAECFAAGSASRSAAPAHHFTASAWFAVAVESLAAPVESLAAHDLNSKKSSVHSPESRV